MQSSFKKIFNYSTTRKNSHLAILSLKTQKFGITNWEPCILNTKCKDFKIKQYKVQHKIKKQYKIKQPPNENYLNFELKKI